MVLAQVFSVIRGSFFISILILSILITIVSLLFPQVPVRWFALNILGLIFGLVLWLLMPLGFLLAGFWDVVTFGSTNAIASFDVIGWIYLGVIAILVLFAMFGLGIDAFFKLGEILVQAFFVMPVSFIIEQFPLPDFVKDIWSGKAYEVDEGTFGYIPGIKDVIGASETSRPGQVRIAGNDLIKMNINIWSFIENLVKAVSINLVAEILLRSGIDPNNPGLSYFVGMMAKFGVGV